MAKNVRGSARRTQPVMPKGNPSSLWRRRMGYFSIAFLLVFFVVGVWMLQVPQAVSSAFNRYMNRPVEQVMITGPMQYVTSTEVKQLIAPAVVEGFWQLELDDIKQLLEQHSWVYSAAVERRWPATLNIVIEEQLPIARWGDKGFLNGEGEYFYPEAMVNDFDELVYLHDDGDNQQAVMQRYQEISQLLRNTDIELAALWFDDIQGWQVEFKSGVLLTLGTEYVVNRMKRFISVYQSSLEKNFKAVTRVDARYRDGIAVQWDGNKVADKRRQKHNQIAAN